MTQKVKRAAQAQLTEDSSPKKVKKADKKEFNLEKPTKTVSKNDKNIGKKTQGTTKTTTKQNPKEIGKVKTFVKNVKNKTTNNLTEKPADWNEFKKKKKELRAKRKQSKNLYDVMVQAKKIGENLRRKTLKGGVEERNKMTKDLHNMLGGQGHYPKLVMTHDMARIVQYLLKFGSAEIRKDIAKVYSKQYLLTLFHSHYYL